MTVRIAVFEGAEGGRSPTFRKQQGKMQSCASDWRSGDKLASSYKEHMTACLRGGARVGDNLGASPNLGVSPKGESTMFKRGQHCTKWGKSHGRKVCKHWSGSGGGKRKYGELVAIPGLGRHSYRGFSGAFTNAFTAPVSGSSVAAGAGIGLVGAGAFVYLGKKLAGWTDKVPAFVYKLMPAIGGLVAGGAALALQYKSNPSRGRGHLLGAALAGAGLNAYSYASSSEALKPYIAMQGLVPVRIGDVYVRNGRRAVGDVYVRNGQLPMAQYADNPRLAGVMAAAMEDEDMPELAMLAGISARRAASGG